MTNEEAIEILEANRPDPCYQMLREAVDFAVNALKAQLPSAQPEPTTEIQEILDYLDTTLHPIVSPDNWNVYAELHDMVSKLQSAQPDNRLSKIADLVEGTIDHFDLDDAMDLLYQIKEVLK